MCALCAVSSLLSPLSSLLSPLSSLLHPASCVLCALASAEECESIGTAGSGGTWTGTSAPPRTPPPHASNSSSAR
eukprot:981550-Rhodomonas_salina.3